MEETINKKDNEKEIQDKIISNIESLDSFHKTLLLLLKERQPLIVLTTLSLGIAGFLYDVNYLASTYAVTASLCFLGATLSSLFLEVAYLFNRIYLHVFFYTTIIIGFFSFLFIGVELLNFGVAPKNALAFVSFTCITITTAVSLILYSTSVKKEMTPRLLVLIFGFIILIVPYSAMLASFYINDDTSPIFARFLFGLGLIITILGYANIERTENK